MSCQISASHFYYIKNICNFIF